MYEDFDERKRALLARLAGAGGRRGEVEGRGLSRPWRGGPAVGLASLLAGLNLRRSGVDAGGIGGRWGVRPPSPGDFPTLPPPAQPPSDGWEGHLPPPQLPPPPRFYPPPPWFRPNPRPPGGPFRPE